MMLLATENRLQHCSLKMGSLVKCTLYLEALSLFSLLLSQTLSVCYPCKQEPMRFLHLSFSRESAVFAASFWIWKEVFEHLPHTCLMAVSPPRLKDLSSGRSGRNIHHTLTILLSSHAGLEGSPRLTWHFIPSTHSSQKCFLKKRCSQKEKEKRKEKKKVALFSL